MDIGDTMDTMDIVGWQEVAHRCTTFLCHLDDKYRNPNDDTKIIRWAINEVRGNMVRDAASRYIETKSTKLWL